MQFLVIAAVLTIFIGNMVLLPGSNTAFLCLSVWLSLCLQSARLKDARVTRWLLLLNFLMPVLIIAITPGAFALWVNIAPKSFAHLVVFEWKYLVLLRTTVEGAIFWIWLILYLLFLLFAPSRLQSDKRQA